VVAAAPGVEVVAATPRVAVAEKKSFTEEREKWCNHHVRWFGGYLRSGWWWEDRWWWWWWLKSTTERERREKAGCRKTLDLVGKDPNRLFKVAPLSCLICRKRLPELTSLRNRRAVIHPEPFTWGCKKTAGDPFRASFVRFDGEIKHLMHLQRRLPRCFFQVKWGRQWTVTTQRVVWSPLFFFYAKRCHFGMN